MRLTTTGGTEYAQMFVSSGAIKDQFIPAMPFLLWPDDFLKLADMIGQSHAALVARRVNPLSAETNAGQLNTYGIAIIPVTTILIGHEKN